MSELDPGILRQYWHLLESRSDLRGALAELRDSGGQRAADTLDAYADIDDFEADSGAPTGLLRRVAELVDDDVLDEPVLVLHYRSALARLEAQLDQYRAVLRSRRRYLGVFAVVALALLLVEQFYFVPTFESIYASFSAELSIPLGEVVEPLTWVALVLAATGLGLAVWLDSSTRRLSGFLAVSGLLGALRPLRRFREAWHAYLAAAYVRLLVLAGVAREDAIEIVRQAVNAHFDVEAHARNLPLQQAVLRDLALSARLDTLPAELDFWETHSLQTVVDRIVAIRQAVHSITYVLLGALALALLWQIYGVVFTLGSVIDGGGGGF